MATVPCGGYSVSPGMCGLSHGVRTPTSEVALGEVNKLLRRRASRTCNLHRPRRDPVRSLRPLPACLGVLKGPHCHPCHFCGQRVGNVTTVL